MKNEFFEGDVKDAEDFCAEIQLICQDGFDLKAVMHNFERMEIVFESPEQVDEVMQLVRDLANNTRMRENNGYTPKEIFEKFEKPNLKPLPDEPYLYDEPDTANTKKKQ
ncbi:MAG: nucleic acid-binding protein, partial [Flexistipes sinusarabici]